MKEGFQPTDEISASIVRFTNLTPKEGISNYLLSETVAPLRKIIGYIALFPTGEIGAIAVKPQTHPSVLYGHVLAAEIPLRVQEIVRRQRIQDDQKLREEAKAVSLLNVLPYIVATLAESGESTEPTILLQTIPGISPETALTELKDRIRIREDKRRQSISDLN
jgi:hypothetical protein